MGKLTRLGQHAYVVEHLRGMPGLPERDLAGRFGVVRCEAVRHHRPDVLACDVRLAVAEGAKQFVDVPGHALLVVPADGFVGVAHAAQVRGDDSVVPRESRHDLVELVPGTRPPGEQDEGAP